MASNQTSTSQSSNSQSSTSEDKSLSSSTNQTSASSSNPSLSNSQSSTQQSSSSGSGTQASTYPLDSTNYQDVILEAQQPQGWGSMKPMRENKFVTFILKGEEEIKFGRTPDCSYIFDKERDHLGDTEYRNISKTHFIVVKTGDSVTLRNTSSNGTFIDRQFVKKHVLYPLVHLNVISMGIPENEVFQYIENEATDLEKKQMPLGFQKKYKLIFYKVLGKGATGEVKKCFLIDDPAKYYAVKILKKGKSFQAVKDFGYESNILSTVVHKNIVKVVDSYENEHTVYMVMELVEGGELFDFIKNNGPVEENKAREYFQQLVDGVTYLHSVGITHRDLKPENILLDNKEDPTVLKITDFGLSRFVSETSLMETLVGTPSYLAPEMLERTRKGYTKKVDSWSLGCILFIILGGYPPFTAEDPDQNLYASIKAGDYVFHEERWGSISDDAKDLVKKLLTVDPDQRLDVKECNDHSWLKNEPAEKKVKKF